MYCSCFTTYGRTSAVMATQLEMYFSVIRKRLPHTIRSRLISIPIHSLVTFSVMGTLWRRRIPLEIMTLWAMGHLVVSKAHYVIEFVNSYRLHNVFTAHKQWRHYRIQSNLSTRVSYGELKKWPLLTGGLCSERQKLLIRFLRDEFRLAFVDRKPLLAFVLMHRFGCISIYKLSKSG